MKMWNCLAFCTFFVLLEMSSAQIPSPNLAEVIENNPDLSEIMMLINDTNTNLWTRTLRSFPPMTLFLPNNNAVVAFKNVHREIAANASLMETVILNHVLLNVSVKASDVQPNMQAISVSGFPLWFYKFGRTVTINEARVVGNDKLASNGVVHVIDDVIYPMGVRSTIGGVVGTMLDYVGFKGLVDRSPSVREMTLNVSHMLTTFIPVNSAVPDTRALSDADITATLKRHVVRGNVLFSDYLRSRDVNIHSENGELQTRKMDNLLYVQNSGSLWSKVVSSEGVATGNGVIHRINGVLGRTSGVHLVAALGLNNLMKMKVQVQVANLEGALNDLSKNYTVFAPSDTAFKAMTRVADRSLSTVLRRHVINGYVLRENLKDKQTLSTLNSAEKIKVTVVNGKVFLDFNGIKAMIITANKRAANGVIHVLDKVLSGSSPTQMSAVILLFSLLSILIHM